MGYENNAYVFLQEQVDLKCKFKHHATARKFHHFQFEVFSALENLEWARLHVLRHLDFCFNKKLLSFGFNSPSRLFHSFWAKSIVRWGENGKIPREKPPQAELGSSHVTRAGLEPTAVRWRAIQSAKD